MESNIDKRHYYDREDTSKAGKEYVKYRKKRLRGEKIDSRCAQFSFFINRFIVEQYDLESGTKAYEELEIMMYLTGLNRAFDADDASMFTGKRTRTMTTLLRKWEDNGYIKLMEGHNMNKRRKNQYNASTKARFIYRSICDYAFGLRKMSMSELSTSKEFVNNNDSRLKTFNDSVKDDI